MSESKSTIDHNVIKQWAEERGGRPAALKRAENKQDANVLRINFPGVTNNEDALEEITWSEFFQKFDEKQLAFLYQQDENVNKGNRYCRLVSRQQAEVRAQQPSERPSFVTNEKKGQRK